jgi:hypothetical protein
MTTWSHADGKAVRNRVTMTGERLSLGTSVLVISGLSALSWAILALAVMVFWSSI